MTMIRGAIATLIAGSALLTACGGSGESSTAQETVQSSNDFCMAFAAKGADPTTLAPFEPFAPKDEVSAEVDTRIATMNGIDPPAELSSIWTKFARYYDAVKQSVATMPDGGHLSDPDLLRDGSLLLDAATEYSSYWSNNCA